MPEPAVRYSHFRVHVYLGSCRQPVGVVNDILDVEALVSDTVKTVLLVEDNEDNRIIYATALRYAGYAVIEAITGTEGVQQARDGQPDLILMDISVPELDGWEATAILKADPATRHIPIVAVTAHALPDDAERSRKVGCDGYLAKPIPPATLLAEVDRRFGRVKASYVPLRSIDPEISFGT
jgi:two-component system cell cycle response regulator DivK